MLKKKKLKEILNYLDFIHAAGKEKYNTEKKC